jgi:integrase
MATITKRTWMARGPAGHRVRKIAYGYSIVIAGKQVREYDSTWSKDDARSALAARILERDAPQPKAPPKALGEVIDEYLALKRAKAKRTVDEDAVKLGRFAAFVGRGTPVTEVTAQRIAQYDRDRSSTLSKRGAALSPATINRDLAAVRHLLRLAEEWGYVDRAPRVRLAKESEGRLRFLSEDEAARLLAACAASKNRHLRAIVTVALNTGMRRGEVMGLTWERVDFARGVLLLDHTKSGRRREVPMNSAVYDALSSIDGGPKDEGPVFRKRGGATWGSIRTGFERACRDAKVHDFRFHDLRHTFASWLVMAGRNLKEVQELLGHRSFAMTLRYAHLSPDRLREAVTALERFGADAPGSPRKAVVLPISENDTRKTGNTGTTRNTDPRA